MRSTLRNLTSGVVAAGVVLSSQSAAAAKFDEQYEVRTVISPHCIIDQDSAEEKAIAELFIVPLLKLAITGVGKGIEKSSKVRNYTLETRESFHLYQPDPGYDSLIQNPNLGCVTVVVGKFDGKSLFEIATPEDAPELDFNGAIDTGKLRDHLTEIGIPLTEEPALVYEASIDYAPDQTAFRLKNRLLHVRQTFSTKRGLRGLAITFEIAGPGAKPSGTSYALVPVSLGEIKSGTTYTRREQEGSNRHFGDRKAPKAETEWVQYVGAPKLSAQAFAAEKAGNRAIQEYAPAVFATRVTEVRKANKLGLFVAELLGQTKDQLAEAIGKELSPSARASAEEERDKLKTAAQLALQEAELAVLVARAACEEVKCNDDPDTAAKAAARMAIEVAEQKRDAAQSALENLIDP